MKLDCNTPGRSGMIPAHRGYLRPTGDWNFIEVTVQGRGFRLIDGTRILDGDVSPTEFMPGKHPGKDLSTATGLLTQRSGGVSNIEIKRLEKLLEQERTEATENERLSATPSIDSSPK